MSHLRIILLAACALVVTGCSSFERDWQRAVGSERGVRDRYSGAWDGQWFSEKHRLPNGKPAGGRLRCIFTKEGSDRYRARFHANWLVFATGYETTFQTKAGKEALEFAGNHDLGLVFGGVYRYEGRVTPERFQARFAARFDHGTFDMRRPVEWSPPRRLTR